MDGAIQVSTWGGKSNPGMGKDMCKSPEACMCLVALSSEEAIVAKWRERGGA